MSKSAAALLIAAALLLPTSGAATHAATATPSSGAHRAATWGPITKLDRNPWSADLAVDGRGRVIAAWGTGSFPHTVWAAVRSPAGAWGEPTKLGLGGSPSVAADARGDITVVWRSEKKGLTDGVRAAIRPAGADWSTPTQLEPGKKAPGYITGVDGYYGATDMRVSMSPTGFTVVTWAWGSDFRDKPYRIRAATKTHTGTWSAPTALTAATGAHSPQVVASPGGKAIVTFEFPMKGGGSQLRARRLADGAWTASEPIVAAGSTALGADRNGIVTVGYVAPGRQVRVVTAPPDGPWSTPTTVADGTSPIEAFTLDVNARGAAVVTVLRDNGEVTLARRTAGGLWLPTAQLAPPSSAGVMLTAGLNGGGDTFVGWGNYAVYGKYRPAAGAWTDRMTVSPDSGVEVLENLWSRVLPNGDVAVMWDQEARPLKVRVMNAG